MSIPEASAPALHVTGAPVESLLVGASEMGSPDAHPHPRLAPDDRTIIWTSSREGQPRPALADLTVVLSNA